MSSIRVSVLILSLTFPAYAQRFGPTTGTLFLAGGGFAEPDLIRQFVELCGGSQASIVVILTDLVIRPGDTETSAILKSNNIDGFGLVNGLLLDVHAVMRNRLFETLKVYSEYPERVAVSIDENTAIILKNDVFEVSGRSYVIVFGVSGRDEPFVFLSAGDKFSLAHNMMTAEDCSVWSSGGCVALGDLSIP